MRKKDEDTLTHIVMYCEQIGETMREFGVNYNIFLEKSTYRNAVALCVLQIGELVNVLSDEFKKEYKNIPWHKIRGMRNIVAHQYGTLNPDITWNTITTQIPELLTFCNGVLDEKISQTERNTDF